MQLKMYMCYNNMLILAICYILVKGGKGLPEPDNVQVGLEFVNNGVPLITVTWDPPLIIGLPNDTKISSYEVAIFNHNKTVDNQQVLVNNQTTSWNTSNVTVSAKYYASVRVHYTTGYSKAINSSSIGVTFLQNFTTYISGSLLRATCHLAKSDIFVDCQLVIVNMKENSTVLSPVNIMQSNFSMLLPSRQDEFLVTARAVDIQGGSVDREMFNITIGKMITPTPDSMNQSHSAIDAEMCENSCTMLTPLAIWMIIIIMLILLITVVCLIIGSLRNGVCTPKKKPLSKSTVNLTRVLPTNNSELTCSPPIPNLFPLLPFKSKDDLPIKSEGPPLESQEDSSMKKNKDALSKSREDLNKESYENIFTYPKTSNIRHSHIQMQECPAYKALSGDYDDICSTAVVMQPNPSYKHDVFSHST